MFSPYIIAGALAWTAAHVIKYLIASLSKKTFRSFNQFYVSGGMPSAHTATIIAVLVIIGQYDGVNSGLFGVTALLASIVMYDAVMVRRSAGEQGQVITKLLADLKSKIIKPRVAKGHTPIEVFAGAGVGFIVGLIVFYTTELL